MKLNRLLTIYRHDDFDRLRARSIDCMSPIRRPMRPRMVGARSTIPTMWAIPATGGRTTMASVKGRCDRDRVGAVLGAVVGGAIGADGQRRR